MQILSESLELLHANERGDCEYRREDQNDGEEGEQEFHRSRAELARPELWHTPTKASREDNDYARCSDNRSARGRQVVVTSASSRAAASRSSRTRGSRRCARSASGRRRGPPVWGRVPFLPGDKSRPQARTGRLRSLRPPHLARPDPASGDPHGAPWQPSRGLDQQGIWTSALHVRSHLAPLLRLRSDTSLRARYRRQSSRPTLW